MPRKYIRRFLPEHQAIREHRHLRLFGDLLHDPNLFHLNRRSVAGAFGVGLFMAFLPVPTQMLMAAAAAILLRVNLPLSVVLVWITNPVTMPPIFYFAYRLGAWVMERPVAASKFELSGEWLMHELESVWQPLLVGSLLLSTVSALLGYFVIRGLWRLYVIRHVRRKRARRPRHDSG